MKEFSWIFLLGGLSFFFFGLKYARSGLQLLAGDRLRVAIAKLTTNRLRALGLGTFITVILQSSTATLLMLVSLAGTGLIMLPQAFGVILGADIGTTVVVILLSIKKISDYALLLVVAGFVLDWISKESKQRKYFGQFLFGFGMVFYGMKLMTGTTASLANDPLARTIFELLNSHPFALLVASILFTVLVQTSAATIGMAIALGMSGIVSLETAIPVVLGANIGTCFSVILSSVGSNINGKRVAIAHLFLKASGVFLVMPFIHESVGILEKFSGLLTRFLPFIQPGIAGNIALFHLFFNVALALFFLPLLPFGVWAVSKLVPEKIQEGAFGPKYLDRSALETPPLAFAQAKQEILRIAQLTLDLYKNCLKIFDRKIVIDQVLLQIESQDDKVDFLEKAVRFYLARISQEMLTDQQSDQQMALLTLAGELEGVGDVISKELASLAKKRAKTGRIFSEQGWLELHQLHERGTSIFELTLSVIVSPNAELTQQVVRQAAQFEELEQELRQAHIQRLNLGTPESFETSSIHLDVMANLRRINAHLVHIAQVSPRT